MIVYTLGTIFFPFNRSVDWLRVLLEEEIITEEVLFQHGTTPVVHLKHPLLTSVASLTKEEMHTAVRQSSLVISHAGQGSTRMLAELGACFVLIPRLKRYGEHVDDHQLLFARAVDRFGVPYCTELEQLINYIKQRPTPLQAKLFNAPSLAEHLIVRYKLPELKK